MNTVATEEPSTSSATTKHVKINSSAVKATNTTTSDTATLPKESAAPSTSTSTPTLAQIGKQTSQHFRLSQISDSGAESGDEQTRLIRSPSARSHKFIIIPATPPTPNLTPTGSTKEKPPTFRPTFSANSLSTLAATIQKTPGTSSQQTTKQQPPLQRPKSVARQLSALASAVAGTITTVAAAQLQPPPPPPPNGENQIPTPTTVNQSMPTSPHHSSINFTRGALAAATATAAATPSSLTRSAKSQSDVAHQSTSANTPAKTATTIAAALNNNTAGVTFTIEDCESDGGVSSDYMPAFDATLHPSNATAISSIKSATKLTPAYTIAVGTQTPLSSSTTALVTASTAPASTAVYPYYRSALTASETTPYLQGFSSRGRSERSSMRSVVSAYIPSSQDPLGDALAQYEQQQQQQQHYLRPSHSGKDLSASSSFIYRDHVANQIYSDVTSVRSLASIGIGSTDGRRLVIRRVPHTPHELFNMVHPPTPPLPGVDDDDNDSFLDPSDDAANLKPRQQHWANKMQFVLACIGYSVGLGNVWRFPYMCYKSGGGVFLVPYCIILFICSIPLLFMELSIGQYTGRGPIGALGQLCPLFKGAGLASVVVSFLMSTYYSVIIGYSIYYFFASFRPDMPWIDCNNRWNTPDCWVSQGPFKDAFAPNTSRTPSEEFFENKVLQISPGIEYPGAMRWELFVCLICAWLMVYFATWKSIKSSAKVRYFTATFPFILIIILMVRAVTLEGADEGLRYFFRPNWSELKHANVWINAASQNFNSLGITFGSMISFASYNKYNNNIVRDTVAVSVVNMLTSLLVGVFAFATLGNLALEQNTNVRDVISDGPGLIFVVYPQAMAKMPYAQLWAVMFFFMLLCLGLNSQFAIVEVVVTSIQDGFPNWIKRHLGYHEIVVLFVCVISFLFGLPNLLQGGIYYFQLMDHYAASISIMFLAFCQLIAVAWFYGTGRLSKNVKQMTGKAPTLYIKTCWLLLGPCLLFAIWVLSLINYEEPSYHNGRYKYPDWAYGIGWMFSSLSLICIPGYAIINLLRAEGRTFMERLKNTLRPNIYECRICGEHHCEHDFPEQEQYMLAQELSGIYKPKDPMDPNVQLHHLNAGNKAGYNPMHLQREPTEYGYEEKSPPEEDTQLPPASTASTSTAAGNNNKV
ncbi:PREDICTED: sodium- and chloride-dependent GABA transporter ine [Rhagoletis zephyria]|uniref:sodium- and chloride-dependent GABA transporter ine n=1 Tax=Rhagoletis zephyria TaxID=28612 RepID=UPI0008112311|nr:PREDICTED: sodium- and chloride-dependent GABA transporter ine [Rhagoletis zephyria]XP_017486101.1 PREDICTED: sodium- and chloride-dependent GABA transporter ine [Rhagoletis zephyria]XP_017486109.1 PREDICTED: sodium- and chloride-dependent GABA transporter ine [Rhagoletis zephyria]XP_017486116.1 PREDICTED: sodium- and chloride-dependent GABA transporter ine [Rhagoletis zephyria]XP_017486123.1 PREDICTED: sodium- and chloride-dependent GABA transporter ine [Rhagoletis zephyria]XP_017486131.1 